MQSVTVGVIRVRDVYVQKSGLPTVARRAKEIDSSPAKGERNVNLGRTASDSEGICRANERAVFLTGHPEATGMLWSRARTRPTPRTVSSLDR